MMFGTPSTSCSIMACASTAVTGPYADSPARRSRMPSTNGTSMAAHARVSSG